MLNSQTDIQTNHRSNDLHRELAKKPRFSDVFKRISIISLPEREDRRTRLAKHLQELELIEEGKITWADTVNGRIDLPPPWFQGGKGAWGCRQSHLGILREARRDSLESILIIEDDAHFHTDCSNYFGSLIEALPQSWDVFFIGGQHMKNPEKTSNDRLVKGTSVTRTHAYAIHRRAYDRLILALENQEQESSQAAWHIDHLYAYLQEIGELEAYAPAWWLAGQDSGPSNISLNNDHRRWWQHGQGYWNLPFVMADPKSHHSHLVFQYHKSLPNSRMKIAFWLQEAAHGAWERGVLPGSGALDEATITALWPGGYRAILDDDELHRLSNYPMNGLFKHPFNQISPILQTT